MTAIDWLISKQKHNDFFDVETIEKAKEIEREQIMDAYRFGVQDEYVIGPNKYYIKKFKQEYYDTTTILQTTK